MQKILYIILHSIVLLFSINLNSYALLNLTFTAHPTNTNLGGIMYNAKDETKYYYNNKLRNIAYVLLNEEKSIEIEDIGGFYSWIGYDFDRSNLKAEDIIHANIVSLKMLIKIYDQYNTRYLQDITIKIILKHIDNYAERILSLIARSDKSFNQFIAEFEHISKALDFVNLEEKFKGVLEKISKKNPDNVKTAKAIKLLNYFNKFKFQLCPGQVRFSGEDLLSGKLDEDIFKAISALNKVQNYAISDIIIANFSTIKQIKTIKGLKAKYDISNISIIPLMETEVDVKYAIDNLKKIVTSDNISQIMKAGSDDTKFSGMAASIFNFAKLGYALENLELPNKPIYFIGMGSSVERSGGPVFYRKKLATILGNNETNRTIQGGELEAFGTKQLTISKLQQELEISKVKSTLTRDDISSISHLMSNVIIPKYQALYSSLDEKDALNQIIKDTSLAFVLDNFQAGSRYKGKIKLDDNHVVIKSLHDLFDDTRAIDFQTTFALTGLHPEFVPFKDITDQQIDSFSHFAGNSILDTYLIAMIILDKQTNPEFYKALGLSEGNYFYTSVIAGIRNFDKLVNKYFVDLSANVTRQLNDSKYLNYSIKAEKDILGYLNQQKIVFDEWKASRISFDLLKTKLFELNYKIAAARNLLNLGVKN